MANLIFCKECGGLKCDESIGNYSWEGGFCHCPNEPPAFKDNEQKMIEEYAEYAKQEIRFCPYCGAALGIL